MPGRSEKKGKIKHCICTDNKSCHDLKYFWLSKVTTKGVKKFQINLFMEPKTILGAVQPSLSILWLSGKRKIILTGKYMTVWLTLYTQRKKNWPFPSSILFPLDLTNFKRVNFTTPFLKLNDLNFHKIKYKGHPKPDITKPPRGRGSRKSQFCLHSQL